jgi:hypothetical protein
MMMLPHPHDAGAGEVGPERGGDADLRGGLRGGGVGAATAVGRRRHDVLYGTVFFS